MPDLPQPKDGASIKTAPSEEAGLGSQTEPARPLPATATRSRSAPTARSCCTMCTS
jgi:hypothetical protein